VGRNNSARNKSEPQETVQTKAGRGTMRTSRRGRTAPTVKLPAEAKAAYKLALEKAGKEDGAFRESVRMRLEALGG